MEPVLSEWSCSNDTGAGLDVGRVEAKGRESVMVSYAEFSSAVDLPFHQNRADRFGG
jgi:hypothetical protein